MDYMTMIMDIISDIEVEDDMDDFINDECLLDQSQIYLEV